MTAPNRLSQDVLDATDAVVLVGGKRHSSAPADSLGP